MLKKHTKHTGNTQLQLDYRYKTILKNQRGKELIGKESGLPEGPGVYYLVPSLHKMPPQCFSGVCWKEVDQ